MARLEDRPGNDLLWDPGLSPASAPGWTWLAGDIRTWSGHPGRPFVTERKASTGTGTGSGSGGRGT